MAAVLPQLGADANVIALAEHRLTATCVADLAPTLRRQKWVLLATPALVGPGGKPRGGVGFLARAFLGVGATGVCSSGVVPG